jgi:DNA-binding SARP family transcriptional activator
MAELRIVSLADGQLLSAFQLTDVLRQEVDGSHARKCLRTELWQIRSLLRAGGRHPKRRIVASCDGLTFDDKAAYWLDVEVLEAALPTVKRAAPERLI